MSARLRPHVARVALACAWLAAAPGFARACAVCGGGNPANRFAFFASTMALSLLPLGLFVGGFLWLRARILRRSADEFRERDVVTSAPGRGPEPLPATTPTHR